MSDTVIQVERLSKRYRIPAAQRTGSGSAAPWRLPFWRPRTEEIWALKDVSFEVSRGEVVGIIGRNGAGKSTLLKILSRITEPTEGRAIIRGRVGSLLEVGTGFHPELTGRENIYLNGAILGMRKAEIDRKFDEIVSFAEVERFLDTPVKHYSSGMYVRLAFAVAAHLETEILLVDEVLAVGDAAFQQKCLGKMGDISRGGRTVLFVSHNVSAVRRLCGRGFLLDEGLLVASGAASEIVEQYLRATVQPESRALGERDVPPGGVRFVSWRIADSGAPGPHACYSGDPCTFSFRLLLRRRIRNANFGFVMLQESGEVVWAMRNLDYGGPCIQLQEGIYEVRFGAPSLPLRAGEYQLAVSVNDLEEGTLDHWYAQPRLSILVREESGLPPQFKGLLAMRGRFDILPEAQLCAGSCRTRQARSQEV